MRFLHLRGYAMATDLTAAAICGSREVEFCTVLLLPALLEMRSNSGHRRGKHFTEWVETVKDLKRQGPLDEAR